MQKIIKLFLFGTVVLSTFLFVESCKKKDTTLNNTQTNKPGTGALPNPSNSAFTEAPSITGGGNRPIRYDLTHKMPPVDAVGQGSQNSCVAWALAYAAFSYYDHKLNNTTYLNGSDINRSSVFSPAFLYNQINNGMDNGSSFWDALNKMASIGVCKWNSMPYMVTDFTTQPNVQQLTEAINYKITNDKLIIWPINDANINKIKDYIATENPVIIRVLPDDYMVNYSSIDTIWSSVGANQNNYLPHAMVIVGYDDEKSAFKVQNSYGVSYKAKGYLWITYSNLKNVCSEGYLIKPLITTQPTKILSITGNLSFGNVAVGSSSSLQFSIANIGNSTLTVSGFNVPNGYALNWSGGTIQANSSQPITVSFSPIASQSYNGTISINSDATSGNNTIQVSGVGTQVSQTKVISLSGNLSYGNIPVGQSVSKMLTISNSGNTALTVSSITTPPGFTGSFNGPIQGGGSTNVSITFSPSAVQSYSGNIVVNSDATSGTNTRNANGNGVSSGPVVVPAIGTYSNCVSVGSHNCPPSYGLGTITARIVSINTSTKQIKVEIKKCNGTAFNAAGNWNVVNLLCGGSGGVSYGFGSFPAGTTSFEMTIVDNNMIGTKAYVPFIMQGASQNILYSAPTIVVTY